MFLCHRFNAACRSFAARHSTAANNLGCAPLSYQVELIECQTPPDKWTCLDCSTDKSKCMTPNAACLLYPKDVSKMSQGSQHPGCVTHATCLNPPSQSPGLPCEGTFDITGCGMHRTWEWAGPKQCQGRGWRERQRCSGRARRPTGRTAAMRATGRPARAARPRRRRRRTRRTWGPVPTGATALFNDSSFAI